MYRQQVNLLLQVLPLVAKENAFALKGGTAINLFVRDMPLENLHHMPAVQWKLANIVKLTTQNPEKHKAYLKALENTLKAG